MAQIISDIGLGEKIGSSLGEGLRSLAQQRLAKLQQAESGLKQAGGLAQLGFDPEQAMQLANLPPQVLQQVVKQKLSEPGNLAYMQALQGILGGQPSQGAMPTGAQGALGQMGGLEQLGGLGQMAGAGPAAGLGQVGGLGAQQATKLAELGLRQQQQREKLAQQNKSLELRKKIADRDFSQKEKLEAYKLTKDERKKITEAATDARERFFDLQRLEKLNQEGKLDTPGYVEFLNRSGLDIPALLNPESQEFQKVSQGFMRGVREIVGGRVSNLELEQFMKTIPTLSQSPEGRQRVIANMKRLAKIKMKESQIARHLTKENFGVPPLDLQEEIYERMEPELDRFAKEFAEDLQKSVPEPQAGYKTALQAVGGSILGSAGPVLKTLAGLGGIKAIGGLMGGGK